MSSRYYDKAFLILFFICLFVEVAKGQNVDSLMLLLQSKPSLELSDKFYELAYEYVDVDYQLGLKYATIAFKGAKDGGDSLRMVKAGKIISLAFENLGKMDSAIIVSIWNSFNRN